MISVCVDRLIVMVIGVRGGFKVFLICFIKILNFIVFLLICIFIIFVLIDVYMNINEYRIDRVWKGNLVKLS